MKNAVLESRNFNSPSLLPGTLSAGRQAGSGKANIFTVILFGLALSGWGMVVYQNELQRQSEERIVKAIWEQVEYRRQAEDSIKQDI